jgi:hypothetical protein
MSASQQTQSEAHLQRIAAQFGRLERSTTTIKSVTMNQTVDSSAKRSQALDVAVQGHLL